MDFDGLPDEWETKGIDFNGDGVIDRAADAVRRESAPQRRVRRVRLPGTESATRRGLDQVKTAFADCWSSNPDSRSGIVLHVNRVAEADRIPHMQYMLKKDVDGPNNDFYDLKRQLLWYCCRS